MMLNALYILFTGILRRGQFENATDKTPFWFDVVQSLWSILSPHKTRGSSILNYVSPWFDVSLRWYIQSKWSNNFTRGNKHCWLLKNESQLVPLGIANILVKHRPTKKVTNILWLCYGYNSALVQFSCSWLHFTLFNPVKDFSFASTFANIQGPLSSQSSELVIP